MEKNEEKTEKTEEAERATVDAAVAVAGLRPRGVAKKKTDGVTAGGIPTEESRRALFLFLVWQRSLTIWRSGGRRGGIMEATSVASRVFDAFPIPTNYTMLGDVV